MNTPFVLCTSILGTIFCAFGLKPQFYLQDPAGPLVCSETYRRWGECKSIMYDYQHFSCSLRNRSKPLEPQVTGNGTHIMSLKKVSMCLPVCDETCEGLTRRSSLFLCRDNGLKPDQADTYCEKAK